jgi:hypothetical protein
VGRWSERVPLCMVHAHPDVLLQPLSAATNNGAWSNHTNWSVAATNIDVVWT